MALSLTELESLPETFNCGHKRSLENTLIDKFKVRGVKRDQPRCRLCHNLANAKYRRKMKRKARK